MNTTFRAGWPAAIAFIFLTAGLTAQTPVKEDILRADKQFDLYAYNLALRTYEQVLRQEPNNAHALARTGDCYFQLNRPQEALSWYDRALIQNNADPEVMCRYGKALMQTGDYVGAKKWFVMYSETNRAVGQHFAQMCDFALQASRKDALFQALNEPLNTSASDYGPAFYGNKVVYSSARTDIQRKTAARTSADWTGSAYNQLYVTQRNPGDNYLQNPSFLRSDLQNNYNEGPVSFSGDGRRVVFCRNNFIDGTRQIAEKGVNMSLHIADISEGNWLNEKAFPYNGSNHATGFPSLSPDGNTLYFASNQEGGFGGWDIYVTTWAGGAWTTPRNLGATINTAGNEVTPFFDGNNLYFSSDWHNGLGGMDVFRADLDNGYISNIIHLGTGVNSSRDDYGFVFDPGTGTGYLTSNRGEGRGNEDIWQLRKRVDEFLISVTDAQQNPISMAELDFSACNAGIKQTDSYGQYAFAVAAGKADCRITVRKTGYRSVVVPISSAGEKNINAVLVADYAAPATVYNPPAETTTAPVTYNYPVTNGAIEKYTVYVLDDLGRPLPAAELNLTTCGLGTIYTDAAGKGSFYFPKGGTCNLVIRKTGLEDVTVPVNDQTRKEMSIAMSADKRTKFSGLVLDAGTRRPVQGAVVTARSRQGVHETLASSNASGQYTLMLRPYQVYDISYGHEGYQNFVSTLQTERALQADMELSPILLEPYAGLRAAAAAPVTYSTVTPASGGMITLDELGQTTPAATTATTLSKQQPAATAAKATGYAVQISANPEKFTESKIRKYDDLTQYGNLYSVKEGKMNKLRLGVYTTREEANTVLAEVEKKHKDAFVVWESQADPGLMAQSPTAPAPAQYSTSIAAKGLTTTPATKTALPATSPIRFAVQVASWPADKAVLLSDYTNLQSLGNVYIRPENDRMRVRVGAWDAHDKAEAAKAEAVRLGYRDAIIVTEKADDVSRAAAVPAVSASKSLTATPVTYSTPGTTTATSVAPASNAKYYIRVCAMSDTQNFDARKLDGSGAVIEKWPIGDTKMTAIMLTGFPTVEQAMTTTDKLRASGFQDAYIIKDENGKMTKFRY